MTNQEMLEAVAALSPPDTDSGHLKNEETTMHLDSPTRYFLPLAGLALTACVSTGNVPVHESAFTLYAPQFPDNSRLELRYAGNIKTNSNCVGENVSPALAWKNVPPGTKSLAFLMYDPEGRGGTGVYHWVAYGINPAIGGFAENEVTKPSPKFTGGKSTEELPYYMGPCATPNSGWHHYTFTAIATDYELGALPPGLTWPELQARLGDSHGKAASSIVLRFGRP